MNVNTTTIQVEKILAELEEIGSSANATIDIIFSSFETNTHWDIRDVAWCLVQKFPKKKFDIEFKIKTLFGEVMELKCVPVMQKDKQKLQPSTQKLHLQLYPEIEQLKEMYEYLPQSFWSQVLKVANEYKKVGETAISSPH